MIVLAGEWVCQATDRETRRFEAGQILLAGDTTRIGHVPQTPTDKCVLMAAVVLA